jgi:catechol 2,3-dioxygenase-like lactoylglutathione lyase family enzyme
MTINDSRSQNEAGNFSTIPQYKCLSGDEPKKDSLMRKTFLISAGLLTTLALVFYIGTSYGKQSRNSNGQSAIITDSSKEENLKLGAFSVSLNVKDLKTSKEFYEKMGFKVFGGAMEKNYLIMKNGNSLIGLFQGMIEGNILTFNPGWDENAVNIETFDDVRKIQNQLKTKGISLENEIDGKTSGPAFFMISDPDGNKILFDQHR